MVVKISNTSRARWPAAPPKMPTRVADHGNDQTRAQERHDGLDVGGLRDGISVVFIVQAQALGMAKTTGPQSKTALVYLATMALPTARPT